MPAYLDVVLDHIDELIKNAEFIDDIEQKPVKSKVKTVQETPEKKRELNNTSLLVYKTNLEEFYRLLFESWNYYTKVSQTQSFTRPKGTTGRVTISYSNQTGKEVNYLLQNAQNNIISTILSFSPWIYYTFLFPVLINTGTQIKEEQLISIINSFEQGLISKVANYVAQENANKYDNYFGTGFPPKNIIISENENARFVVYEYQYKKGNQIIAVPFKIEYWSNELKQELLSELKNQITVI